MANSRQATKRARQTTKHRLRNQSLRSKMRTGIKSLRMVIKENDHSSARVAFTSVQSLLDKMVVKNVVNKKKAARLKSRLNLTIKNMA